MDHGCLASRNLGEHERAMLEYVTGIVPLRREVRPDAQCDFMLLQDKIGDRRAPLQDGWQLVWKGNRPGDNRERFSLFGRKSGETGRLITASGIRPE